MTIMLDVALDKRDRRREEYRRQSFNRYSLDRHAGSDRHASRSRRQTGDNPGRPRTPEIDDKYGNSRNR